MTRDELLKKITEILADVVDDPKLELTERTTSEDVPDWDSINHVKLIVALEKDLRIHFATDEINSTPNVGGLIDLIQSSSSSRLYP